ncbi:MAG: sn-glycerol-1-phosphate dehydrogenase [Deltaproteobacteria bacterium]|nr:MAG: sn-glycerol-1-phosphate dehydrogenase [Deltaproteobacteria bacterium]TMQ18139.1 MAG: sn-glycerol-1-phosphate dehydrogenase [Deltaproteobacteria bacterium]
MPAPDPGDDPLAQLLAGDYRDPETGEPLGAASRAVVIEDSLDGREADLVAALGLGDRLAVVADEDTHAALGRRVERALAARFSVQQIVLGRAPHADTATLDRLAAALDPGIDAVVAVGSGTINDLCKLAALGRGRPQVVFATAPSMNGYTSLSASITEGGLKRTVRAATPVGAFFDLGVLAAAPIRLIRAGLGDSVCRPTAQADWLLAHLLFGRAYREAPFALLARDEPVLLAEARGLVSGDLAVMRSLVRTLVLSGFGMTICGGSYPASQGEHLLSHYIEMMRPPDLPAALHGEQTGVCALAMARLQDRVLARDAPPVVHPTRVTRDDVLRRFGAERGEACWRELEPKRIDRDRAEQLTARLAAGWDAMRARIRGVTLGHSRMVAALAAAGAPTAPDQLGWPDALLDDALAHAREIRNRYTFLDFALDIAP